MAEEIGMVDHLVDGRLEVGFARGSSLYEYERLGLTDVAAADRLRESLDILLGLWGTDAEFHYKGSQFEFPPTYIVPRPLQQPHPPLWVAARTPDTLRFCIERGIGLHTTPLRQPLSATVTTMNIIDAIVNEDASSLRPTVAVQTETCVSNDRGRIMHAMKLLERNHVRGQNFIRNMPVRGFGSLDPLPEGMRITAEELSQRGVVGDPATCVARIRRYQSLGADEFIASMDFGQPQREILRSIELFASQVIPQCREPVPAEPGVLSRQVRAGASERRQALLAQSAVRFGNGWQEWDASDWLAFLQRRHDSGEPSPYEIFDFAVAPRNARADAAGVVGTTGRLILLRDQSCPECGRPILALCYRANGESPQHMRETLQHRENWPAWHAAHP
jgi:alkanesulfonate monooxygenase SsuD/methylene tetrahydromethanopterin reductase-like flavin-dependent oxidoreductase (luciferase family)